MPSITTGFSRLGDAIWLMKRHRRRLGSWPNPWRPLSFNDWVHRRLLLEPHPLDGQLSCKLGQRDYKAARIGPGASPPLLGTWEDVAALARDWDALPGSFMLKPTHASSWYRAVPNKALADGAAIIDEAAGWLRRSYYRASREIGYRDLVPRLIAEPLLQPVSDDRILREYNAYAFDGRIAVVVVRAFGDDGWRTRASFDAAGRRLAIQRQRTPDDPAPPPPPEVWSRIAEMTASLSRGLDFVRCDFLLARDGLWASELSPYPYGGRLNWEPTAWNDWLGAVWAATRERRAWPEPPK